MLDVPAIKLFQENWFLREERLPAISEAEGHFIEAAIGQLPSCSIAACL